MVLITPPPRTRLSGIWLPLITPFSDGSLDEDAVITLVRHYKDTVDGLILAATTGEGLTLDDEETERLAAITAEAADGTIPIFLGLCGSDTRKMLKQLDRTRCWPIAGYLISCPYYTRPSQEGLYRHFIALAEEAARPIALYNIPYRTGVNLANETLLHLAEHPAIIGVKDCCAIPAQSVALLRQRPPGFAVMTGEDALFLDAIVHGADGGILASAHVDQQRFARTRNALLAGDLGGALALWNELADVVSLLFTEPSPAPIKYWLWREGLIPSPEVRLPMTTVSEGLGARISALIAERIPGHSKRAAL